MIGRTLDGLPVAPNPPEDMPPRVGFSGERTGRFWATFLCSPSVGGIVMSSVTGGATTPGRAESPKSQRKVGLSGSLISCVKCLSKGR